MLWYFTFFNNNDDNDKNEHFQIVLKNILYFT